VSSTVAVARHVDSGRHWRVPLLLIEILGSTRLAIVPRAGFWSSMDFVALGDAGWVAAASQRGGLRLV
jgi:hypothetical protein